MDKNLLHTPVTYIKGVGPAKAEALAKELMIETFEDMLQHYPFRYIDKTKVTLINEISEDSQFIQLRGKVTNVQVIGDARKRRLVANFADTSGYLELIWFKGVQYFQNYLQLNQEYLVFGKPTFFRGKANMAHPEVEPIVGPIKLTNRWMPVYGSTEKLKPKNIDSKGLGKIIRTLFEKIEAKDIPEIFPPKLLEAEKLMDRYQAFLNIHLPTDEAAIV